MISIEEMIQMIEIVEKLEKKLSDLQIRFLEFNKQYCTDRAKDLQKQIELCNMIELLCRALSKE